jgi:hypothetical protein
MYRILTCLFCSILITALAEPLVAQVKVTYKCISTGRYWKRQNKGPIRYCWDGTYYSEQTVPEHVKAFFAKSAAQRNAAMRRDAGGVRASSQPTTPANTVAASTKPVAAPVGADLFASIETGAESEDVLAKLGRPHGSMSNLGDEGTEEVWSYRLPDGGVAKLRLDRGKVIAVQLPR